MKHYISLYFFLIFIPAIGMAANESSEKEPIQKFILKIDDVAYEVPINSNQNIVVSGKPHKVRIELSPTRKFNKAGLSFDFDSKRHFSYEALSPVVDHWSLDISQKAFHRLLAVYLPVLHGFGQFDLFLKVKLITFATGF